MAHRDHRVTGLQAGAFGRAVPGARFHRRDGGIRGELHVGAQNPGGVVVEDDSAVHLAQLPQPGGGELHIQPEASIAKIFDGIPGLRGFMKYWYHFAIMFEALFILTTIDTGTRVARFLVGEFGGRFYKKLEEPNWLPGSVVTSALVVAAWAAFIWSGSISTIWPMFGIANQLLAAVALCVATTIIINSGRAKYAWVTILPLAFVSTTTLVAGFESITDIFWPLAQKPETAVQGLINTSLTAIIMFAAIVIMIDSIRRWLGARRHPQITQIQEAVS